MKGVWMSRSEPSLAVLIVRWVMTSFKVAAHFWQMSISAELIKLESESMQRRDKRVKNVIKQTVIVSDWEWWEMKAVLTDTIFAECRLTAAADNLWTSEERKGASESNRNVLRGDGEQKEWQQKNMTSKQARSTFLWSIQWERVPFFGLWIMICNNEEERK